MTFDFLVAEYPLAVFGVSAGLILVAGVKLTRAADELAAVTGLASALVGAVVLGAMTSLSGAVTSISAAFGGQAELAISNALGGIAVQTVFLVLADLSYRHGNLEHDAATITNLFNGCLLMLLLDAVLIAMLVPPVAVFGISPFTVIILMTYGAGIRLGAKVSRTPMWTPAPVDSASECPERPRQRHVNPGIAGKVCGIAGFGLVTGIAGYCIAESAAVLSRETGIAQGIMGGFFTAIASSSPELVTTLSAIRRRALALAVGGILGGNAFDVLFVAFADIAYRDGSIFHAVTPAQSFLIVLVMMMTSVLLLGLISRQRHGVGNIGFEGVLIALIYGIGMLLYVTIF